MTTDKEKREEIGRTISLLAVALPPWTENPEALASLIEAVDWHLRQPMVDRLRARWRWPPPPIGGNVARRGSKNGEGEVVRINIACALALMLASLARAADVDWKLYGGASLAGPSFCFYDAASVTRTSNSYIRAWTKCLAQKDLDGVNMDDDVGKKIVDGAARRVVAGYVPPIIVIGQVEFEQLPSIAAYEEIANVSAIEPQAQIFTEMNCSERMTRRLSTSIHPNGRSGFQNKPSEWEYVPPEGNAATLQKILCPKQ